MNQRKVAFLLGCHTDRLFGYYNFDRRTKMKGVELPLMYEDE
ncbi:hypothetical protein [Chitinophaga sp.]|nr:hypothetical protein [Chitinophaga sp.]